MKQTNKPHAAGPLFTLDEFGTTYQDVNPPLAPIR